jgi:methanogenic corrinoid protein MtbC1
MTTDVAWGPQVEEYLSALQRGDRSGALQQARALRADGHELLELILRLIAPAQLRVGELWVSDRWSVAQEHAATAISEAVLTTLAVDREGQAPLPEDAPTVVVSCVEQEWHALPALMVTEQLRASGFAVSYLGANSSSQGLVRHIHDTGPSAVLLSCALSSFLTLTRREIEAVRETGTPVVVGGSAFDAGGHRARVLGATGFATGATDVVEALTGLPTAVPPAPPLTHDGADEAFVVFADRESLSDDVSRKVLRSLAAAPDDGHLENGWRRVLEDQLPHLVGSVAGALVCDDPRVVSDALAWADLVLGHRNAPAGTGTALRDALADALHDLPAATRLLDGVAPPR